MATCKFTDRQLWDLVNRANTHERVQRAEEFLTHLDGLSVELYNELMMTLAFISRELYHNERGLNR